MAEASSSALPIRAATWTNEEAVDYPVQAALPLFAPPRRIETGVAGAELKPFDENEERVYFDRRTDTWKCEIADEGDGEASELEWDAQRKSWLPVVDDELIRAQQKAYSIEGVDEEAPVAAVERRNQKKRRRGSISAGDDDKGENGGERKGNHKQIRAAKTRINSSVYVTGLPLDASKFEIASVFSRYGVLNEDDQGEPKIKMYADEKSGMFKGEALVTFFKPESVELAIQVLDESALRAAEGKTYPLMTVEKARFGNNNAKEPAKEINIADHERRLDEISQQSLENISKGGQGKDGGQRKPMTDQEKKKAQKRYAKMYNKLTDWNSDSDEENELLKRPSRLPTETGLNNTTSAMSASNSRQVCLRRMFTLAELDEEPTLLLDLKEDVREECETLGKVTNVVLWDKEPDGIMTVKFSETAAAQACVEVSEF